MKLELLRDQEIDALVDHGLLPEEERWNTECRNDLHLIYPEMNLDIVTGVQYPVRALKYQVKNISLPRIVADQLIVALRDIHTHNSELNTFDKCWKRDSSTTGCYGFEMAALHMATRTVAHLKHFRMDPTYWKDQTVLNRTDYHLSLERRQYLEWCYGIDLIPDDPEDDKKNAYDPFNPD